MLCFYSFTAMKRILSTLVVSSLLHITGITSNYPVSTQTLPTAQHFDNARVFDLQQPESQEFGELWHVTEHDCQNVPFLGDLKPGVDIIYPMMSRREQLSPIKTFSEETQTHRRRIGIRFIYKGQKHRLKLEHNRKLMLFRNTISGKSFEEADDCYYQGYCSKRNHTMRESLISLSTCDGLRGVIEIDGEPHVIYPYEDGQRDMLCRPHLIYKLTPAKDRSCGNQSGQWTSFEKLHQSTYADQLHNHPTVRHRMRRNAEPKYLALAMVVDSTLYGTFNWSEDEMMKFVLQVTNIIDMFYQSVNIRVGLVHTDFWTEDKSVISVNPRESLQNFLIYTQSQLNNVNYDLAHLISGQLFEGNSSGLAIPDSICTGRGVAVVSSQSKDNSRHLASIISHMIGHSIGLLHDSEDCICEDDTAGCIMNPNIGHKSPTKFSSCSVSRLEVLAQVGLGSCLIDEPAINPFPQFCGNGFVERGEQCDCGPAANCEKVDPCCDPDTCLLKFWAKCKSGPCCHQCLPKQSNEVCREANGDCDAPEYCDGVSGECPADVVIADGQQCPGSYCYQGWCPTHDSQCQRYWNSGSSSADAQCYEINNVVGSAFGHCGIDQNGVPIKCNKNDAFCGLLQCQGGASHPIHSQLGYTSTMAGGNGNVDLTCKSITTPTEGDLTSLGLVVDGTKCGESRICLNHQCITSRAVGVHDCPVGVGNKTCSGYGRCTTIHTCSCDAGYRGRICDELVPTSSSLDIQISSTSGDKRGSSLQTKWLIVIICVVAAAVALSLVLVCLFCRRQIVSPSRKKVKRKTSHLNESMCPDKDTTISFGHTPSYRSEKDGKRKRRRKRKPSSSSGEDETDSDERKQDNGRPDIVIPEELSRQPERGILKKSISSAFEGIEDEECCNSQCSCSDSGSCSCSDHEQASLPGDIPTSCNQEPSQEIPPPLEFDTNLYAQRFQTSVDIEVNPCQEISPTNSEDMKYCATEVDQFYKPFTPQYEKPTILQTQNQQHHGGDSATDSAIDMPADGSVSTINEIPPHHSTAILSSSYYKHTPTVADYSDMQLQLDITPADPRFYASKVSKYRKAPPSLTENKRINSPVLCEYSQPPTNRSLADKHDSVCLQTFKTDHNRDSPLHRHENSRHSDASVTV